MNRRQLTLALDDLVDPCLDASGDWADVLVRAGITTAPARRPRNARVPADWLRSRRLAVALTAAVLVTLVFLATGFGRDVFVSLLGRIDINFGASKPAPALVRRDFASLTFGVPPALDPQAIASQTRAVTEFRIGGHRRTLWVAPTRRGGFCWQLEKSYGGCFDRRRDIRPLVSVSYIGASADFPGSQIPARIEGVVTSTRAARLTVEFRDGTVKDVPFVFVSKPIDAGFFVWTVPREHQGLRRSIRALTARDPDDKIVARATLPPPLKRPRNLPKPLPPHPKRPIPPSPLGLGLPAPTPPFQHGRGDGVSATVGRNGVSVFDATQVEETRREVLHRGVGVGCFRIEHDQLGIWPREQTLWRRFGPTIKIRLYGPPHPYDGCEIQAGYGHRWPDRFGSHSAIEIPLTPTGRRYFMDRAAARDLALFVRSMKGGELRRETGPTLARDLGRIGGGRVVRLGSIGEELAVGKIGYLLRGRAVTYVERSPTGRRFYVRLEDGHIKRQNVKPWAFVY
jgi:hypothetical protein